MGHPNPAKSSEPDRRSSSRASTRLSHVLTDGDGDDDDYDLQAMAISDGFRPVEVAQNHNVSHVTRPSVDSLEPPVARAASSRPSSVSKPSPIHESFALPDNTPREATTRSSGVSTDSTLISAETPYEGPTGPSHPYQMYPQDVRLARTASLATTSTAPVSERSYTGPRRPAHPYAIYSQNVVPGDDGAGDRSPPMEMNVGFPGTINDYQRRLGPDGEEAADMIGPNGHTEQLPPYTRYPVEAYTQKALGIHVTRSPSASSPTQQSLQIPGAGGIGLATRNPEFSSTEDLNPLSAFHSRRSTRSFASEVSQHSINTAALAVTNEKKTAGWKTAARRKVWGVVPCWAVVLGVIVLVLLGIVIGTVIGTELGSRLDKDDDDDKPPDPPTGTDPWFIPIPTAPLDLPPLVVGQYSLPLMNPLYSQRCFQETSQSRAWSCDVIMSQLIVTIRLRQNAEDIAAYALDLTYNSSYTMDSFIYTYGVQPPSITDQELKLVYDRFEQSRGPAWAFALHYNKTVILPEQYLVLNDSTPSGEPQRRMMFGPGSKRKGLAQSGDKPWICSWPSTTLEVFIYADQNSAPRFPMPSRRSVSTTSSLPLTESSMGQKSGNVHPRGSMGIPYNGHEGYDGGDDGGDDDDYDDKYPPNSHSPTPAPSDHWPTESTSSSKTTPTPSGEPHYDPPPIFPPPLPVYPKVIKVEERRNPKDESPLPICRQVKILGKGQEAIPVKDANGKNIEIQIAEVPLDEEEEEREERKEREEREKEEQSHPYLLKRYDSSGQHMWGRNADGSNGNEISDCGCIWWIT
ncbi:hypothetical protein F5Y14DRAFT_406815 [Nemania sp. NC0429]|nr:hypothetical protein F5Y14DRAFT_406815 [Nemania sp. NC0429]